MTLYLRMKWKIKAGPDHHQRYNMKHVFRLKLLIWVILSAVYSAIPVSALSIDADNQLAFADACFKRKQFAEAVAEYNRFLFFFPDDQRQPYALYQTGLSFFKKEQFNEASDRFHLVMNMKNESYAFSAGLMLSKCYFLMGSFDRAIGILDQLIAQEEFSTQHDRARYEKGWLLIENGYTSDAKSSFMGINEKNQAFFKIGELVADLDACGDIKLKSPALAGTLAILPGAGYLYCGRANDARIAFLLNSLLIYATYESFDHDLNALGTLVGLTAAGFYGGNIYGSVTSAKKYNRSVKQTFIDKLVKNKKIRIGLNTAQDGIDVNVDMVF